MPAYDLASTDYLLSIGGGILEASSSPVHTARAYGQFRQGRTGRRGKFVQVEPRLSITASSADEWIAVRPGTEGIFALGVAGVLVSEGLYNKDFLLERTQGFEDVAQERGAVPRRAQVAAGAALHPREGCGRDGRVRRRHPPRRPRVRGGPQQPRGRAAEGPAPPGPALRSPRGARLERARRQRGWTGRIARARGRAARPWPPLSSGSRGGGRPQASSPRRRGNLAQGFRAPRFRSREACGRDPERGPLPRGSRVDAPGRSCLRLARLPTASPPPWRRCRSSFPSRRSPTTRRSRPTGSCPRPTSWNGGSSGPRRPGSPIPWRVWRGPLWPGRSTMRGRRRRSSWSWRAQPVWSRSSLEKPRGPRAGGDGWPLPGAARRGHGRPLRRSLGAHDGGGRLVGAGISLRRRAVAAGAGVRRLVGSLLRSRRLEAGPQDRVGTLRVPRRPAPAETSGGQRCDLSTESASAALRRRARRRALVLVPSSSLSPSRERRARSCRFSRESWIRARGRLGDLGGDSSGQRRIPRRQGPGVGPRPSARGAVTVRARVTSRVVPGVAAIPVGLGKKGGGRWANRTGANPLRLLSAARDPLRPARSGCARRSVSPPARRGNEHASERKS